jgi:hypothetical protein
MTRNLIGWMVFQVLVGIWLVISPYVLGFKETMNASINSMIFGAVVILIGLGMSIFNENVCGVEHVVKKTS